MKIPILATIVLLAASGYAEERRLDSFVEIYNPCGDVGVKNCHDCGFKCLSDEWEQKWCRCDCKDGSQTNIWYKVKYDCDDFNCNDSDSCDSSEECDYLSSNAEDYCGDESSEDDCEECCEDKCDYENQSSYCERQCKHDCIEDAHCDSIDDDDDDWYEDCDSLDSSSSDFQRCDNKNSENSCKNCCWSECGDINRTRRCRNRCYDECKDDADCYDKDDDDDDDDCDDEKKDCCRCVKKCVNKKSGIKSEKNCIRNKCKGDCKDAADCVSGYKRSEWKDFFYKKCSKGFKW